MKPLSQTAMAEATRLTTEGRLDEAMALLRGAISSAPATAPSFAAGAERQPAPPKVPEFIDMVPPSPATGGRWTSPFHAAADSNSGTESAQILPEFHPRTPPAGGRTTVLLKGARFEQLAFTSGAGSRHYKLCIPSSFTGQSVPLVMMLHGCTQSPDDFAAGTRMNLLARQR